MRNIVEGIASIAILAGITDSLAVAGRTGPEEAAAVRPDADGKATRVSVRTFVVDVSDIDDAKHTFTADIYVLLNWKDARLASSQTTLRNLPLASVWHPPLLILNQRSVNRLLPETVRVNGQGNVEYQQRFEGTFSVPLNLRSFPRDEQTLALRIVSPGLSPTELELIPEARGGRTVEFSILDWSVGQPTSRLATVSAPDGTAMAGFTCELVADRLAGAYVYQFVIPLSFIVAMSWAAFWMAPDQLGPRHGIAVTSMLTIIAYRFVLAGQLPRVAYLTRFDYLLLGCTTLVFLVLAEVVIVHVQLAKGRLERAYRLDVIARGVFPAMFLLLIVGVWLL